MRLFLSCTSNGFQSKTAAAFLDAQLLAGLAGPWAAANHLFLTDPAWDGHRPRFRALGTPHWR